MRLAAVPLKSLRDAKSRLHGEDRAALAKTMLTQVLRALLDSDCFGEVAVVSPDPEVLAMAQDQGASGLLQTTRGLNPACEQAAQWAAGRGAQALLLAHADLPCLEADDVRRLVALGDGRPAPHVVLGPDRRGTGTNLLLASPPQAIPFAFGVDSRHHHRAIAREARVPVIEYVSVGTASDVDTPVDLAETRTARSTDGAHEAECGRQACRV